MLEAISGDYIGRLVAERDLSSIRVRTGTLAKLDRVERIIFVGSTCVGKTTLEAAIRNACQTDQLLAESVSVPQRVVIRPPRLDDKNDIYFCSADDFRRMVLGNTLGLYGVKLMENGREEIYGYIRTINGTFPIFFANNQTIKNKTSVHPEGVLQNALIILIYATDIIREERLRRRSPQLFETHPDEVAFRLSKEERAIRLVSEAHLIVKNYGRFAGRSSLDVILLIKELLK